MIKVNPNPPTLTPQEIERFWSHVNKATGQGPQGECWQWMLKPDRDGYGSFAVLIGRSPMPFKQRRCRASRLAYFLTTGEWPTDLICHTCDWRPCCRPDHLFVGSPYDNALDRGQKGRTAKGERSGYALHPESWARGDDHWTRKYPEKRLKGSEHGNAIITESIVLAILALGNTTAGRKEAQRRFGISHSIVSRIHLNKGWKHVVRP